MSMRTTNVRNGRGREFATLFVLHPTEKTMDQKLLDEINEKIRSVMAQSPAADLEKNMRAMLTALFSRLDLVTREEFDVQRQVLARAREKLTQLEARLAELEGGIQDPGSRIQKD